MLYPFRFQPIFKDYLWGGRKLETLFRKPIPPTGPVAESWEIVDRPSDNSVIANGPLAGRTLRWLMEQHGPALLGRAPAWKGQFPLLVKILDARESLSLQVHPSNETAPLCGGEPKTEMWHVVHAEPGAWLVAGLKRGVTRAAFEAALRDGTVEQCVHRLPVRAGDTMFVPGGRLHAIGVGCTLFEIQQNSDTTYRVFDWNRRGPDGRPRPLHVAEALRVIDFDDFEPSLARPRGARLVECPFFTVERHEISQPRSDRCDGNSFHIVGAVSGAAWLRSGAGEENLAPGTFVLVPAVAGEYELAPRDQFVFLKVFVPHGAGEPPRASGTS